MMNSLRHSIFAAVLLLLASCGGKETPHKTAPAIRIEEPGNIEAFRATFRIDAVNTAVIRYGTEETMPMRMETGSSGPVSLSLTVDGLTQLTQYTLYVQGFGPQGEAGSVMTVKFSTATGPDNLYPWESARNRIPSFADISLITMGWHNYNPPKWTPERFSSQVSYNGKWLFDAFLCVDGWDPVRNLSYSLTNNRYSATKESWEYLLDAWTGEDGALTELDRAIDQAGTPPRPRYVVMCIPDPIRFQYYSNKDSATDYWDGNLDFALTGDQIAACKWYMDSCRERFQLRQYKHLELAGFYVLSEELPLDPAFYKAAGQSFRSGTDDWNWQYKNWEIIVPALASYAHSCNEGLWWIPYHLAPGYRVWKDLGFDLAWMQPNYYWDHDSVSHPLSQTRDAIRNYRMGVELEFEYSLVASVMADGRSGPDSSGSPTFYAKDVPMLRQRVRDYMEMYRNTGLYGVNPIAVYSGTDAWNQLATSKDAGDMEMFREICNFITESPLKR